MTHTNIKYLSYRSRQSISIGNIKNTLHFLPYLPEPFIFDRPLIMKLACIASVPLQSAKGKERNREAGIGSGKRKVRDRIQRQEEKGA